MMLNVTKQKSNSYDTSFQVQDGQLSGVTKEYSDDSLDGNRCIKNSAISKGVYLYFILFLIPHKKDLQLHFKTRMVQQLPSRPLTGEVDR